MIFSSSQDVYFQTDRSILESSVVHTQPKPKKSHRFSVHDLVNDKKFEANASDIAMNLDQVLICNKEYTTNYS